MKASTPYFTVFAIEPIAGTRIPIGAMVLHGHAIKYVARKSVPRTSNRTARAFLGHVMERIARNEHPWDIGPTVVVDGSVRFAFHDGEGAEDWIARVLDGCHLVGGPKPERKRGVRG